jgi:hypothetical protein
MTTAQLIAILQTMPQDQVVLLGDASPITEVISADFNHYFGADPCSPEDPVIIIT